MEFLILLTDLFAYLLPWIIAERRGHASKDAIAFVTVFLGWTGIMWLFAMIWSLTGNVKTG